MKTHEELITMAFKAYENSSINYGLTDSEMVKRLSEMSDAVLWGFISYCESYCDNN